MKKLSLAMITLLALSSAAFAQGGPHLQGGLAQAKISDLIVGLGPTHSSHLVQNSAECAPSMGDPIWGPNGQLAGFSCYESAGAN